jgi:GrpB-like predicted nucleotidyltransferase (UPF0157 family)
LDRGNSQPSGPRTRHSPIEVVPYDESWPARFAAERDRLEPLLAAWLAGPLEHVGSTAVAGMPAKPIIDIMAPVHSLESSRPAIQAAESAGYCYAPYQAGRMHWFCKPSPARRTHHLHLVPRGSALWRERLAFRDALRADVALAAEYAALKFTLAAQCRGDREAYTAGKGAFIARVLAEQNQRQGNVPDDP